MDEDMWQKSCVIYKITNLVNGKVYVGQTRQKLKKRIYHHKNCNKHYLGHAIQKYGWENFKVEILEECGTPEKLNERETFWIKKLNCQCPNGYNMNGGGDNPKGRKQSEDEKFKRSIMSTCKKSVRCIETGQIFDSINNAARYFNTSRKNISGVCQGRQITAVGHRFEYIDSPLSKEAKLRQAQKPHVKKVRCIESNQIFNSITEAACFFKMSSSNITQVCRGKTKTAGGYHWEFVNPADLNTN